MDHVLMALVESSDFRQDVEARLVELDLEYACPRGYRESVAKIISNLDELVQEFSRRLTSIPDYAQIPEPSRMATAREGLSQLIVSLESQDLDSGLCLDCSVMQVWLSRGYSVDSIFRAMEILSGLLQEHVRNAELIAFFTRLVAMDAFKIAQDQSEPVPVSPRLLPAPPARLPA